METKQSFIIILIPTILIFITTIFWTPFFETNDDVSYMLLISGKVFSSYPETHVYSINYFLSESLAYLYKSIPNFPWYGLMHIMSINLSLIAILLGLSINLSRVTSKKRIAFYLLFILLYIALTFPIVIKLQFTKTAFFAAQGAFFLLIATLCRGRNYSKNKKIILFTFSLMLLFFSFLFRKGSCFLAFTVFSPLILVTTWRFKNNMWLWDYVLVFACLTIIVTLVHSQTFQSHAGWKEYRDLNSLKSHFTDYNSIEYTEQNIPFFAESGWSKNDFYMVKYFAYANPEIYSLEKFRQVVGNSSKNQMTKTRAINFKKEWSRIFKNNKDNLIPFLLITISTIFLLAPFSNIKEVLLLFSTIITTTTVLLLISYYYKMEPRVYYPAISSLGWTALFLSSKCKNIFNGSVLKYSWVPIALFIILISIKDNSPARIIHNESNASKKINTFFKASLNKMKPREEQLFINWNFKFPYTAILPLEKHQYLKNFNLLALGTMNQSPVQKKFLKPYNTDDPFLAFAENKNVLINISPFFVNHLHKYLKEHYDFSIKLIPYYSDPLFTFYKAYK